MKKFFRFYAGLVCTMLFFQLDAFAQTGITKYGTLALVDNTTGDFNSGFGYYALRANTSGSNNTANGFRALRYNTTGSGNTAVGEDVLYFSNGRENTAIGSSALRSNLTGDSNTAAGYVAMYSNTTGTSNTAYGYYALEANKIGNQNTATGDSALLNNTTGNKNSALGFAAGQGNKEGSGNVFLGYEAGKNETRHNRLYIANNEKTPLIFGKFSKNPTKTKLGIGTKHVPINDAIKVWNGAHLTVGGVWANASSRDLKDNIQSLSQDDANTALAALEPVRYVYRNSPDEEYMGFIAEDVPELVATNDRRSLAPMDIVAVLTTVVKEQQTRLDEKSAEMEKLRAEKDSENAQLAARLDELSGRMDRLMQTMEAQTLTAY